MTPDMLRVARRACHAAGVPLIGYEILGCPTLAATGEGGREPNPNGCHPERSRGAAQSRDLALLPPHQNVTPSEAAAAESRGNALSCLAPRTLSEGDFSCADQALPFRQSHGRWPSTASEGRNFSCADQAAPTSPALAA